jgi:predicted nucleic acid-binding protein
MRVVLDTNILISALLIQVGHPAVIYRGWQEGAFTLLVCVTKPRGSYPQASLQPCSHERKMRRQYTQSNSYN